MDRPYYSKIWNTLASEKEMIFISGPRQSGKTTFAKQLMKKTSNSLYCNWDIARDKQRLLADPDFFEAVERKDKSEPLIVFDEIHKYKHWKNYLKGVYDGFSDHYRFLALGSGRLSTFKKGGDSLAGRYELFTLWPLTLAELFFHQQPFSDFEQNPLAIPDLATKAQSTWEQLFELSGFPQPFLSGKEESYRRWSRNYHHQVIREDIRNIADIRQVEMMEALFSILPFKVSSPLSLTNLASDIQVSYTAVKSWLALFDSFFLTFRIAPWHQKISRSITKEQKLYLYDFALIEDPAARYEDMVACELQRAVTNWTEMGWGVFSLAYLRNRDGKEVDFVIVRDKKPWLIIEAKWADGEPSDALQTFQRQLKVPALQLIHEKDTCQLRGKTGLPLLTINASRWLSALP